MILGEKAKVRNGYILENTNLHLLILTKELTNNKKTNKCEMSGWKSCFLPFSTFITTFVCNQQVIFIMEQDPTAPTELKPFMLYGDTCCKGTIVLMTFPKIVQIQGAKRESMNSVTAILFMTNYSML